MARKTQSKKHVKPPVKISWFRKTFNAVKSWVVGNGIEGFLGLVAGLLLWSFGFKIYAGIAFGVFATKNWELLKKWFSNLKEKI
ncbi:hypothetical protein N9Q43_00590 [bacterium]|nr:hypothetical protein [bacterium]|tara:strand:+ start:316 stop:567 length:252 start_codon:yes stop_codon:yes gene_type:complete